jgi:hypothetical protein
VAAANAVPANDSLSSSESGSFSSDGGEFESQFSWTEESSNEDLDYFAALDVTAAGDGRSVGSSGWCEDRTSSTKSGGEA